MAKTGTPTPWTATKSIWYRVVDAITTLYVEPVGEGFDAYLHRFGSFEPHGQRYFSGPDGLAQAQAYLDRLTAPVPEDERRLTVQDEIDAGYHVTEDNS